MGAEGVRCFVATGPLIVLQKKEWIHDGDLTPNGSSKSWHLLEKYQEVHQGKVCLQYDKIVGSNLLMEECEICRRDFSGSYGHSFIYILAPESYNYSALGICVLLVAAETFWYFNVYGTKVANALLSKSWLITVFWWIAFRTKSAGVQNGFAQSFCSRVST